MEPKYSQIFDKKIIKSLIEFCELNKIDDSNLFIKKCFELGFNIEKYGLLGKEGEIKEKIIEVPVEKIVETIKEVIVEKEVPVEKVVEIIKEVPIEKIIEKEIYITDDEEVKVLTEKIFHLEQELSDEKQKFSTIIKDMENSFQKESDNEKKLTETLQKLRKDISEKNKKIEELEKINQDLQKSNTQTKGFYMRGSNLNDIL